MSDFMRELDARLHALKADFIVIQQWEAFCNQQGAREYGTRLRALRDAYARGLRELRLAVRANFARFDAAALASLWAIPTLPLDTAEQQLHRIWLGGRLPALAAEAVRQWHSAIGASRADGIGMTLWVWDAAQLQGDPAFIAAPGVPYRLGSCVAGGARLEVHSLQRLARARVPALAQLLEALHAQARFVNLADFFRLLVLHECGGIYLDVDTMPYRAAPLFLACPEVPDYVSFGPEPRHISWMNLIDDENGLLVAKRANPALGQMVQQMSASLQALRHIDGASLHEATYAVWRAHLGLSFNSFHQLAGAHSILHDDALETIVSGVRGMRLTIDALSGEARPLDAAERAAYQRCVDALAQRGWHLDDPRELAALTELTTIAETPRMAYAAQLRAEPESCHYYSFLSEDRNLDRVNALFGAYLLARNGERIARGDFWCRTRGRPQAAFAAFDTDFGTMGAPRAC